MLRIEEAIFGDAPFNSKISTALSCSDIAAKCSALKSHSDGGYILDNLNKIQRMTYVNPSTKVSSPYKVSKSLAVYFKGILKSIKGPGAVVCRSVLAFLAKSSFNRSFCPFMAVYITPVLSMQILRQLSQCHKC